MRIDHAYVETRSFEAALAFWRALGFEVREAWGEAGHRAGLLGRGDARLVLAEAPPDAPPQRATVHFDAPDLDALGAAAATAGRAVEVVTPVSATHWGTRWLRVRDPDGNLWAFEARAAREGTPTARHVLTILAVDDVPQMRDFYAAGFGWRVAVDVPVYAELEMPGGMRLGLYARGGFARNTGEVPAPAPARGTAATELYLRVDDPGALAERLRALGARSLSPAAARDWGDEVAYVADPEGNVLALARSASS